MRRFFFGMLCVSLVGCVGGTGPDTVGLVQAATDADLSGGIFPGDQVQWNVMTFNASGVPINASVVWSSTQTSVVTMSASGLMAAVGPGIATITAANGRASVNIQIIVDGNVSGTVVVNPPVTTTKVGTSVQFTALLKTTRGNPTRNRTALWSSASPSTATVDATGKVTALVATPGVAICATAPDVSTVTNCANLVITP